MACSRLKFAFIVRMEYIILSYTAKKNLPLISETKKNIWALIQMKRILERSRLGESRLHGT